MRAHTLNMHSYSNAYSNRAGLAGLVLLVLLGKHHPSLALG